MYLMVSTRPDIAAAVGILSRFMENPGRIHWEGVKRVLRYVQGTKDFCLRYESQGSLTITGFCDSDWAGCLDTRKSTGGYVFLLGKGAISWSSKRQKSTSLSSCEAEYVTAAHAAMEVSWLRNFLGELHLEPSGPIMVGCDSQSAMNLIDNPVYHERSKHIQLKMHYIREQVSASEVEFSYVATNVQVADCLTKAVPGEKVRFCRGEMGVKELKTFSQNIKQS